MTPCLIPEYAVGIRAARVHTSDQFAQPRCYKNAWHGAAIGEWETKMIAPGADIPKGWRVIYADDTHTTIRYTYWLRVTP